MNVRDEKKYIKTQLGKGESRIDLTYWVNDNPKSDQLQKLKTYAETQGCSVVVVDGFGWPKGLRITNLLSKKLYG